MESNPPKTHTLSLLQLIMGVVTLMLVLAITLLILLLRAGTGMLGGRAVGSASFFSLAIVAGAYSLLLLPSVILPIYRLQGKALPAPWLRNPFRAATGALALWPVLVLAGWFISERTSLGWLALPVLSILAIGIPVWWLVEAGRRRLPSGSLQRSWGLLGYGVLPNMALILVSELVVILLLVLAYGLYASTQPNLLRELNSLADQIRALGDNPQRVMEFARSYLMRPGTIFVVLGVGSVLMPLLEEALKPLGMWFIAGRFKTPAEGFSAGLVCGGAFAFVESLNLASNFSDTGWTAVVFARVGAGLLHVITSGLVGWGLVSAWTQGRYLRQGLTFLAAVMLHGLWNFFGLLMGFSTLLPGGVNTSEAEGLQPANLVGPLVLVVIAGVMLVVLFKMNRRLAVERQPVVTGEPGAPSPGETDFPETPGLLVESNSAVEPREGSSTSAEDQTGDSNET